MPTDAKQFSNIASFVLDRDLAIAESALAMATKLLADTIGVAAGAARLEVAGIARDFAADFHATDNPKTSGRMMFDGRRVSIPGAAWAAATQIDSLDAHDGFNPVKGHIGCAVVPALFAFAENLPGLTGREALTTLAMSYEVAGRAGLALHSTVSDYHTSGAWNALAVAALGCRLLEADTDTLRQALGIAEYHGPRSQMMREIDNPTMLHDGSGIGALTGTNAALLAMRGFTGAPALTIEDDGVADIWTDLGDRWTIEENYIKPYPICRWAHAAIDAARYLKLEHGFEADDVEKIEIRTFAEASRLFAAMPKTTSQAQYSMAFAVATMLRHGEIAPEHIADGGLSDPAIEKIVSKVEVTEADRHNARFPSGRWSDATVTLKDGRIFDSGDVSARGGFDTPLELSEVREKFDMMTQAALLSSRSDEIWNTCFELLNEDATFSKLARLVCAPVN
ncbi:MAG: MmgE/PrpD family protein [Rhizobiaceae bacterium]